MTKKSKIKKTTKKSPKTLRYGFEAMESCINKTVERIKGEIMPHVALIDKRDKEQFEFGMNAIATIKDDVKGVRLDMSNLVTRTDNFTTKLDGTISDMNSVISNHIKDEELSFDKIHKGQEELRTGQIAAKKAVDDLNEITKVGRAWTNLFKAVHNVTKVSFIFKPFKTVWGSILTIFLAFIIINSLTHPYGFTFNLQTIWHFLTGLFGR